jgi:hypothetical protein
MSVWTAIADRGEVGGPAQASDSSATTTSPGSITTAVELAGPD